MYFSIGCVEVGMTTYLPGSDPLNDACGMMETSHIGIVLSPHIRDVRLKDSAQYSTLRCFGKPDRLSLHII